MRCPLSSRRRYFILVSLSNLCSASIKCQTITSRAIVSFPLQDSSWYVSIFLDTVAAACALRVFRLVVIVICSSPFRYRSFLPSRISGPWPARSRHIIADARAAFERLVKKQADYYLRISETPPGKN